MGNVRCANCLSSDVQRHVAKGKQMGYACNCCGVCLPFAIMGDKNGSVDEAKRTKETAA